MHVTLDAKEMAGNLGTGWLTTRKAKKRKPLKEKNEGLACTETEEKVCRYRIQHMLSNNVVYI